MCDYFCDKWFLYPKILRKYFIEENKNIMTNTEDVLIITSLDCYEENNENEESKDVLSNFIYFGFISVQKYIEFISKCLVKMEVYKLGNFILHNELKQYIQKRRYNRVIDEIKNEVAYRPNKVGYEETKERFEQTLKQYPFDASFSELMESI
jgi:hypothetical protein